MVLVFGITFFRPIIFYGLKGGHTPPTHLIADGCYGTVTLILFLAGLFYEVTSKDNYQRTLLTNYQAERINLAEDLAPSLSHIKDIELDR